ncbi:Uncharacterized protein GBIM_11594 [Gryllus bimaculatus]|nr:Uncharacterized protein GBIM_11594 [Gryllus bimaculatus]
MQNANGPCPLIAVANTLLLRGRVLISDMVVVVSAAQLVEYVSDAVADTVANVNAHDAIAVLPELQHGLDVNVRFGGVSDFEPTRECAVFDVLRIPLYHGWLVDPQCEAAARAVGRMGYNELVEHILANKSRSCDIWRHAEKDTKLQSDDRAHAHRSKNSPRAWLCAQSSADQRLAASALQAEEFLASTASQLTYHGLCELAQAAREGEVAVFFRNNHFSTLYKHKAALYLLVTDQPVREERDK